MLVGCWILLLVVMGSWVGGCVWMGGKGDVGVGWFGDGCVGGVDGWCWCFDGFVDD